jgi:hypothetical protein
MFFNQALAGAGITFTTTQIRSWQERQALQKVPKELLEAFQNAGSHTAKTVSNWYAFSRFHDDNVGVAAFEQYCLSDLFESSLKRTIFCDRIGRTGQFGTCYSLPTAF